VLFDGEVDADAGAAAFFVVAFFECAISISLRRK
jgi:hypothetical protein